MAETLERALFMFESTSNHAVVRLYRRGTVSEDSVASLSEDNSILAGAHSESIFLVYLCVPSHLGGSARASFWLT